MDDTYLWSHDRQHLQRTLAELEVRLAKDGLAIHPEKTAILYSEEEGGGSFHIGGEDVPCKPWGTEITALGSPLTFVEPVASITAAMNQRARKAFGKHSKLLVCTYSSEGSRQDAYHPGTQCSPVGRPILAQSLRRSTKLSIPPSHGNYATMLGDHRSPGETWVDWNCRTLRRARVALFQSGEPRWSTFLLSQTWGLYGHMARSPEAARMLSWKNLHWWKQQQQIPRSWGGSQTRTPLQRQRGPRTPDLSSGGTTMDRESARQSTLATTRSHFRGTVRCPLGHRQANQPGQHRSKPAARETSFPRNEATADTLRGPFSQAASPLPL